MLEIIAIICLIAGIGLLILLSVIDLKTYLLPNIYVAPFALLGILFHFSTDFYYLDITQIFIGGIAGFTVLFIIRAAGNKYYGQDSLGLGDVKLFGAGGLWLGLEGVLFAMTLGAIVGLLHGLVYATIIKLKTKQPFSISRLTIPAGPGFAVGIMAVACWMFQDFAISSFYDLLP